VRVPHSNSESSGALKRGVRLPFAHPRATVLALLLVQGVYLGYGVSPLMSSRCVCEHGPEVPCDCPHHGSAKGEHAPPCHLHRPAPSDAKASPESAIRVRCGAKAPDLILMAWGTLPSNVPRLSLDNSPPADDVCVSPHDVPASPRKPPPKARV